MRKPNSEYYREFRTLFEVHEPGLLPEFDEKVKSSRPLEVFMWLEGLRTTRKELWESLDPLLTDFFIPIIDRFDALTKLIEAT